MKRLLFIINPRSGKGQIRSQLLDIVDILQKGGYHVELHITQCELDAKKTVKKIGKRFDRIVCSGGDGTLNETVAGMIEANLNVPLGYIPAGSTNDFATSLKIPKKMDKAASVVIDGEAFQCDIGSFNGRYFNYVAAFGAFTEVSYGTPQQLKNWLGHPAYILEGMKQITTIKPIPMKIVCNGQTIEGTFIYGMITNSASVGGFKKIVGKSVALDDGLFEVTLIRNPQNALDLQDIINGILLNDVTSEHFITLKTESLEIESPKAVPWVLDGEYGGEPEKIIIKNHYRELNIMVPGKK